MDPTPGRFNFQDEATSVLEHNISFPQRETSEAQTPPSPPFRSVTGAQWVTADPSTKQRSGPGHGNYIPANGAGFSNKPYTEQSLLSATPRVYTKGKEQSLGIPTSRLDEARDLCEHSSDRSEYLGAEQVPRSEELSARAGPAEEAGHGPRDRPAGGVANVCTAPPGPRAWPSPAGAVPRGSLDFARRPRAAKHASWNRRFPALPEVRPPCPVLLLLPAQSPGSALRCGMSWKDFSQRVMELHRNPLLDSSVLWCDVVLAEAEPLALLTGKWGRWHQRIRLPCPEGSVSFFLICLLPSWPEQCLSLCICVRSYSTVNV
ncbi:uncharacterized protein LOC131508566 [Neofelis nebulosa]|uniref:uncharacterized protein LOC131508566 n=1 Tax=Neofelis nebulosa TaxID=61452 RepID=UPI00272C5BEB|nr:uncharacterized protein LOC131508566 [Neofelis nebulosa]